MIARRVMRQGNSAPRPACHDQHGSEKPSRDIILTLARDPANAGSRLDDVRAKAADALPFLDTRLVHRRLRPSVAALDLGWPKAGWCRRRDPNCLLRLELHGKAAHRMACRPSRRRRRPLKPDTCQRPLVSALEEIKLGERRLGFVEFEIAVRHGAEWTMRS